MITEPKDALDRGVWGAEEIGLQVVNAKLDMVLIRFEFTELGFGHYYLRKVLKTQGYTAWRFYGELRVPEARSDDGALLVTAAPFVVE